MADFDNAGCLESVPVSAENVLEGVISNILNGLVCEQGTSAIVGLVVLLLLTHSVVFAAGYWMHKLLNRQKSVVSEALSNL